MKMDRYLTAEEERTLFGTVANIAGPYAARDWAWMMLLRHTGIRIGALAGLTVADARKAMVTGTLTLKAEHAKRSQAHDVPVNKKAKMAMRKLLKASADMGYHTQPDQPLVMGRNHKGLSIRSFQARMNHWIDMSGLEIKATPHWFRHTLAIRIMEQSTAKNPLRNVSAVLGHKNPSSTLIYTQPTKEQLAATMEEAS